MPTFTGTDGNDVLVGSDGDDLFYSSKGQDILNGGAGYDKAIIDYSAIGGTQGVGQNIGYDSFYGGLYGSFRAWDGLTLARALPLVKVPPTTVPTRPGSPL